MDLEDSEARHTQEGIKLSVEALIEHYLTLSLPQFHRPDFILVMYAILMRRKSFTSGVIKCKTKLRGEALGCHFSKLTPDEVALAANRANMNLRNVGIGGRFLSSVTTSCRPLGHSNESAEHARKQYLALCDTIGLPTLFVSAAPDDSMSFRIKVFVKSGQEVSLPSLDWSDDECFLDLKFRAKSRLAFPGICSLEFQSVMEFLWKYIIGWDKNEQKGKNGIFGVPIAVCEADEEQGRKTLHSHWLIWIKYFNSIRSGCYHKDRKQRDEFRKILQKYVKKLMCATYGDQYEITHMCLDGEIKNNSITDDKFLKEINEIEQCVRDGRHKDHCFDVEGKIANYIRKIL